MTLNRLLTLLVASCLLLSAAVLVLQMIQSRTQDSARAQLNYIMTVQSSIDVLRSRLWLFQRYNNEASFRESQHASTRLHETLKRGENMDSSFGAISNLMHMQSAVERLLILSEKNIASPNDVSMGSSQSMLSSRLNMLLLSMSEEVLVLHQRVQAHVNEKQDKIAMGAGVALVLLSLTVTGLMIVFRHRFKGGLQSVIEGIRKVRQGELLGLVEAKYDDELQEIADELSDMKFKLNETMVSRDGLQQEVERQTRQLKVQHDALKRLANTDSLTGLLNRRAFDIQAQSAIARARRTGTHAALLFIDLNDFKLINDTYGHEIGDMLLSTVAETLMDCVRETDLVARLGGDEFIVWLDLIDMDENVGIAVSRIMQSISKPINVKDKQLHIKLSIGVALYPKHNEKLDALMKLADEAMYTAKEKKHQKSMTFHIPPWEERGEEESELRDKLSGS